MSNAIMLRNLLQLFFFLYLLPMLIQASNQHQRKPYIVYMGEAPESRTYAVEDHHHNLLAGAIGDKQLARESKIHSYGKSFNGFVARLLPHEAEKLLEEESVISVFANKRRKLHTTRSWDFLGLPLRVTRRSNIESHIIVGMLDTGIWMDCPSFNDTGYGPPPRRWKGKCVTGANFTGCNNKVIGAKYFNLDDMDPFVQDPSPVDDQGHGSHTAAIAAGVPVVRASLFGIGKGTARGGVPSARIAVYKVCWTFGCSDMDLLAGFDEAIADGVNFISVSIGGPSRDFFSDPIAIGAFHAMKRGVLTSCSAGNSGPYTTSVENVAPWILTVGASSIDRQFTTVAAIGDGNNATGMSINTFSPGKKMHPLINGALAANRSGDSYGNFSACDYGTLSKNKVKGKIVYCLGIGGQDYTIQELGGAGIIMAISEKIDISYSTVIPGVYIDIYTAGKAIDVYINSTKNAQAVLHKTTSIKVPAPFLASFSSRGPQVITPNILKPDLTAPGRDILSAYSKLATITGYPEDTRHNIFNILSGTSMACPHATAAAAYVKSFHPDWTPAAIKSALMTTATPLKTVNDELAELGFGSGQINPARALHPGLVYDIRMNAYVAFLCKQGYNGTKIGILFGRKRFNCSNIRGPPGADGLNYPTLHIQLKNANSSISAIFHRTVTNVGYGPSTYKAKVITPRGLSIQVTPDTLQFTRLHQKRLFKVVLKGPRMPNGTNILSASLEWNDSKHSVRSPILVYSPLPPYGGT